MAVVVVGVVVVVDDLGLTTLLTSQVISVAFYTEREKTDKFCSEALISAWGSFTFRKSTTQDLRLYYLSEGSHTQEFYALKNPLTPAGFEPANLGSSGEHDNHWIPGSAVAVYMWTLASTSPWIFRNEGTFTLPFGQIVLEKRKIW